MKICKTYDSSLFLLEAQVHTHQNTRMRMFTSALFLTAPNWRLKCPGVDQIINYGILTQWDIMSCTDNNTWKNLLYRRKNDFPSTLLSSWLRPLVIKDMLTTEKKKKFIYMYTSCICERYPGEMNYFPRWCQPPRQLPSSAKDNRSGGGGGCIYETLSGKPW